MASLLVHHKIVPSANIHNGDGLIVLKSLLEPVTTEGFPIHISVLLSYYCSRALKNRSKLIAALS